MAYVEIANKLHTYTEAYKDLLVNKKGSKERFQALSVLREELETVLNDLSSPWLSVDT